MSSIAAASQDLEPTSVVSSFLDSKSQTELAKGSEFLSQAVHASSRAQLAYLRDHPATLCGRIYRMQGGSLEQIYQTAWNKVRANCNYLGQPVPECERYAFEMVDETGEVLKRAVEDKMIAEIKRLSEPFPGIFDHLAPDAKAIDYLDRLIEHDFSTASQTIKFSAGGHLECLNRILSHVGPISVNDLNQAVERAAWNGDSDCLNALIHSGRFNKVWPYSLRQAVEWAALKGHVDCLNALFQEVSPECLGHAVVSAASRCGTDCLNALIHSSRFNEVPPESLGYAVSQAARDYSDSLDALIHSGRFNEVPPESLGRAVEEAASDICADSNCLYALIHSGRINEVPPESLGRAIVAAVHNKSDCVNDLIIQSGRINEVPPESLERAITQAKFYDHVDCLNALIQSRRI